MKIRTLEYFVKEAAISLKRNNLMSFASITTVAISLVILGLFLIMVMNLNNMAAHLESQVQINVYLEDNLSEAERYEIGNNIKKIKGVEEITFVTKVSFFKLTSVLTLSLHDCVKINTVNSAKQL